ncbi:MAG: histidinol-phosphate transaminase [Burkholderiaceae bacterium]
MSRFWSPGIDELTPYVPGEQPKLAQLVKLNTNENPYPPSPAVLDAIRRELGADGQSLRLYPDPTAQPLREVIAAREGLQLDQIFVGNGSDEVLGFAFRALLKQSLPLRFPDISYSFYPVYCRLFGIDFQAVPLADDFALRIDDYEAGGGPIILPNPNAPTGRALPRSEIERLLERCRDAVVVIDEAYVDFGAQSAVPLIAAHDNLLVVRTLSKSHALAGLRIGYALGQLPLIEALTRVKDSFNSYPIDRLAMVAATAALSDDAWLARTRQAVIDSRETLVAQLTGLGCEVLPSQANFIFARHPRHAGAALAAALRAQGIIVRHFGAPRIGDWLRITIGTPEQCAALVGAMRELSS